VTTKAKLIIIAHVLGAAMAFVVGTVEPPKTAWQWVRFCGGLIGCSAAAILALFNSRITDELEATQASTGNKEGGPR